MRTKLLALGFALTAGTAIAQQWETYPPGEGDPQFYAFILHGGAVVSGTATQLSIVRDPYQSSLLPTGRCSFDNCTINVSISGQTPKEGDVVSILFSNDFELSWTHGGSPTLLHNYATYSMGATNYFYDNMRQSEWVDIHFGGLSHRFSLVGSNTAIDGIIPFLGN